MCPHTHTHTRLYVHTRNLISCSMFSLLVHLFFSDKFTHSWCTRVHSRVHVCLQTCLLFVLRSPDREQPIDFFFKSIKLFNEKNPKDFTILFPRRMKINLRTEDGKCWYMTWQCAQSTGGTNKWLHKCGPPLRVPVTPGWKTGASLSLGRPAQTWNSSQHLLLFKAKVAIFCWHVHIHESWKIFVGI